MQHKEGVSLRADARRNRERILDVALAELTRSPEVSLSEIADKAGVGKGTFYRNFPNREALVLEVYHYEVQQVVDSASDLLKTREPDQALREWMDHLARFIMAKTSLAGAMRQIASAPTGPENNPGYAAMIAAMDLLLRAAEAAGTIRPGVTADDFRLAIGGLWQIDPRGDWKPQATRLLDFVMDGLRAGAPRR